MRVNAENTAAGHEESTRPVGLKLLLEGIVDPAEQARITRAYFTIASGDPESFPVQFAIFTQATARTLAVALEENERDRQQLRKELIEHAAAMRKAPLRDAGESKDSSSAISEQIRNLKGDLERIGRLKLGALIAVLTAVFLAGVALGKFL